MNLKNKGIGGYMTIAAAACTLIALICAVITGVTMKDLSAWTVILMIVAIAASAATLVKDFHGVGSLVASVCAGAGMLVLLIGRLNKIGLILSGVVEESIPVAFIIVVVLTVIAMVLHCIVGFIGTEKKD